MRPYTISERSGVDVARSEQGVGGVFDWQQRLDGRSPYKRIGRVEAGFPLSGSRSHCCRSIARAKFVQPVMLLFRRIPVKWELLPCAT
jgi:hypothetical protein